MSIQIVKIQAKLTDTFSIWINESQGFNEANFFTVITSLGINKKERIYSSFGPAQFIDEIHTKRGVFSLSQEFDEFAGCTIYSDNQELMNTILCLMVESKQFNIRK